MPIGTNAYALLGLTAVVAGLVAVLVFSLLRFIAAARATRRGGREDGETTPLLTALEEAMARLKAQERATAARAEASERLSSEIMASLTAGLLVVGMNAEIRILNPAGRRLLGEPTGLDDYRLTLAEPMSQMIDECLATRAPILRRTVKLESPRDPMYLGVTVSPLIDPGGEFHGAICLFSDLTVVKDLEEQLRLKDSLAAVGELTAGIAHEFRNGLATIQGYSKLMDLRVLPEAYRPYVEGIRAETESLAQVVTNFLTFARPAQLTLSRVDLRAICDRAAEDIRGDARALGGDVDIRGQFGATEGDEVLLRQAFSNLMRNALEACTGASVVPAVVVESQVDDTGQFSRISINDNGRGIDPRLREQIFKPFYTTRRGGTGLGLALVQKIIVFHNGRINVGTSPQGGAAFQITLPLV
jgi:nitrogen fixation/metabolism regulation signal transduction histidine kinase